MKINSNIVSLLLAAGSAVTLSEASSGVGQGNMHGVVGSFESSQRTYTNPTKGAFGENARSIQDTIPEGPNPLPPGWSEHFDQSSGQYYYYNSLDGTTTWNRPSAESRETSRDSQVFESGERADIQSSDFTAPSEKSAASPQESETAEDSPFGYDESWDPVVASTSGGRIIQENSVQSRPSNLESQVGDNISSVGHMATDSADNLRWTQQNISPKQVENRESLQTRKGAIPREPGFVENYSRENIDSEESQGVYDKQGNMPHADSGFADEGEQGQRRGGWGLPNQGSEEQRQRSANQPPPSAFVRRENSSVNAQHFSHFGGASEVRESRQVSSPGYSSHEKPNSAYQMQQDAPGRSDWANGVEREHYQQFSGGSSASNGQSASRHQQLPSSEKREASFNGSAGSKSPNPPHGSHPEGPRSSVPLSQNPRPQYPQQRSPSMPSQAQYRNSQYMQPQGNPRPSQYSNYNYNGKQGSYNEQPSVGEAVTSVFEDGTAVVKDVLGKSWQGLLGFSSRTREAMGQARDQVVTGASVAGQSISAKSTDWWGQAKSAFGSVFEKSEEQNRPQYTMSNQYGGQPQQRYSNMQNTQGYQGQNPTAYTTPSPRGQAPNSLQHERQRSSDQHVAHGQQPQPQNGQSRRPGIQTRYDPPLPHYGQARPPPQAYQNQYQHAPRYSNHQDQQDRPINRRPQQLNHDKHSNPWSHPGLSGDV